jgi:hypothetical protein
MFGLLRCSHGVVVPSHAGRPLRRFAKGSSTTPSKLDESSTTSAGFALTRMLRSTEDCESSSVVVWSPVEAAVICGVWVVPWSRQVEAATLAGRPVIVDVAGLGIKSLVLAGPRGATWKASRGAVWACDTGPRPLNTTSSELDDMSEAAGDGLRIAICAMASVVSCVEESDEGVGESSSDSDSAGWAGSRCSLIVPSRCPALTNCMGICRSFLPVSKAGVRWFDMPVWRASSMRENWGVATGSVNTQSHGEVKGGVHSGWSAWRLAGVRCGVLFAEPLPLLFPFLRDMRSAVCVNAGMVLK